MYQHEHDENSFNTVIRGPVQKPRFPGRRFVCNARLRLHSFVFHAHWGGVDCSNADGAAEGNSRNVVGGVVCSSCRAGVSVSRLAIAVVVVAGAVAGYGYRRSKLSSPLLNCVSRAAPLQFGWYGNRRDQRMREASVDIKADWTMVEEIEFSRLAKLSLNVPSPSDVYVAGANAVGLHEFSLDIHLNSVTCGQVERYDKVYDRVSTKMPRPLQQCNKVFHNVTTTDDPIIRQVRPVSMPSSTTGVDVLFSSAAVGR